MANSNPWSNEGWNLTTQMQIFRTQGAAAAEALAKAAGTHVGGPRPAGAQQFIRANWILRNQRTIQQVAAPPSQLSTVGSVQSNIGLSFNPIVTRILMLEATTHALGYDVAPLTVQAVLQDTNHQLGVTEAALVTTALVPITMAMGLTEAAILSQTDADFAASLGLGINAAASVQLEVDLAASPGLGISEAATLTAASSPPSFVNDGGYIISTNSISFSPALPGSRVNGNLLIAMFESGNNRTITLSGSGWTSGGAAVPAAPNTGFVWAWRIVDGTEASPTFSASGGTDGAAVVLQYHGVAASPIGATNSQGVVNGSISMSITTTAPNSLVVLLLGSRQVVAFNTPTGYTVDSSRSGASVVAMQASHIVVASSGTVQGTTGAGNGGANEDEGYLVELLAA